MIVLRERRLSLPRHDVDRHDLFGEPARRPTRVDASCWLRSAYSSCASREMPYFAAQFSAVIAIEQPQCVSSSASHSVSSSFA